MAKDSREIKLDPEAEKIDLRGKTFKKKRIKKKRNVISKKDSPIHSVKDLSGDKKYNYIYIRGKKFTPPKHLGSILRIGVAGFLIIMLINVINVYFIGKSIQNDLEATAHQGYSYLLDAGKSATKIQFDNALEAFNKAQGNFQDAEDDLWFINSDMSFYAQEGDIAKAVTGLLEGGKHFAEAGKWFLEAVEEFNNIPLYFVSKNAEITRDVPSITDSLKVGLERVELAIEEISIASEYISKINENSLPPELQARVIFAKNKVQEIAETLEETKMHFPAILKLLGDRYPHRYLILLQNNNEIRPTGGFIGSYAIVDVNDGYIEKLETHDVYDIDGSYGGLIIPPEEFLEFTGNWRFRDSNYSPDFAVSAKKARWFLEKEGGPTVDTVIAINQGLLRDMLEITGPVQVGEFGKLDADNYNLLLSFVIEGKVWGTENPKHILKVFIPAFKEAILKEENIGRVSSKLYKAVQQKHIMFYSSDAEVEALFDSMGVSGKVHESAEKEDYLSVINVSTGGTKSEQFMEEKITHITNIATDGTLTNEVEISRSHLWTDEVYLEWKNILGKYGFTQMPDHIIDILGRGENKVGMRVYVPEGSVLMDSDGKDVATMYDEDLKKTYFYIKMHTKAGETSSVNITYTLPFKLDMDPVDTYRIIVEKQPGSRGSIFNKRVTMGEEVYNLALHPEDARLKMDGMASYSTNLVYDQYFAGIFAK